MKTLDPRTRGATPAAAAHPVHDRPGSLGPAPVPFDNRPARFALQTLQALADSSAPVQGVGRLQAWMKGSSNDPLPQQLLQRVPIGAGGKEYSARNCAKTFALDHLAGDEAGAEKATLQRPSGDTRWDVNTVLMHTEQEINAKVLSADWDATVQINGPVWRVPIDVDYLEVSVLRGGNNTQISGISELITGTVWVKVYFDYAKKEVSVTGVHSTA